MDLEAEFIRLSKEGYAPHLVYDDHGNWGITDSAITPLGKKIKWCNLDLTGLVWKKSPSEAMKAFLKKLK